MSPRLFKQKIATKTVKVSIRSYRRIGTVGYQEIRKKASIKLISKSEVMGRREANTSIEWKY